MNDTVNTITGHQANAAQQDVSKLDAVVRKAAWRLIPILFLAYLINFIDRVNISFAKLQMSSALSNRGQTTVSHRLLVFRQLPRPTGFTGGDPAPQRSVNLVDKP